MNRRISPYKQLVVNLGHRTMASPMKIPREITIGNIQYELICIGATERNKKYKHSSTIMLDNEIDYISDNIRIKTDHDNRLSCSLFQMMLPYEPTLIYKIKFEK